VKIERYTCLCMFSFW